MVATQPPVVYMRNVSTYDTLLRSFVRNEGYKVLVKRKNGATVDISSRVNTGDITHSDDEPISTLSLELEDAYPAYSTVNSLNPMIAGSVYNQPEPLLMPDNEIMVYVGVASLGSPITRWEMIFHGVIGDEIRPRGSKSNRTIDVHCRDLGKRIQDAILRGQWVWGTEEGEAVVAVMQSVLNQTMDNPPTLLIRDNPEFMIYPTKVGNKTTWAILQDMLKPTGYTVRYWYWPKDAVAHTCTGATYVIPASDYYLTVLDPKREQTTPVTDIDDTRDHVQGESIELSDKDLRNDVTVDYYDRDTDQKMSVNRQHNESIARFGRRPMTIGQDDVPYIDTYVEAWDLAGVVLWDLHDVQATDEITMQLRWDIEVYDIVDVSQARLATGTQAMGVRQIVYRLSPNEPLLMEVTGVRDRVIGQVLRWIESSGNTTPTYTPASLQGGYGRSFAEVLPNGELRTEVILEVIPPASHDVEEYHWKWSVQGEAVWHDAYTSEPVLRLYGLPAGKVCGWTCQGTLAGEER